MERSALKIGGDGEKKERKGRSYREDGSKLWSSWGGIYRMFERRHRSGHG